MSFNHCVQFLQQLHVCAGEWLTGFGGSCFRFTTPVSGSSNAEEQDQLYGFTMCLLQTDCTCIPLTYIINTWKEKKQNKEKHPIKLWYPARTACWMQVLIQYTNIQYIRTRTCIQTGTHTRFFSSLYTHNNTLYTNTPTFIYTCTHTHTQRHYSNMRPSVNTAGSGVLSILKSLRRELWSPVFASFLSFFFFFAIYLKRLDISWMWRILLFNTKIQGGKKGGKIQEN